jgi:matrix metalloproteinase-14 (membrane-inserted)
VPQRNEPKIEEPGKLATMTRCLQVMVWCVGLLAALADLSAAQQQETSMSTDDVKKYFNQFGYMGSEMSSELAKITDEQPFVSAVKSFQRMANLTQTGVVDNDTMTMLLMPRCGVKDQTTFGSIAKRRKRYLVQGTKWPKGRIVYKYAGPVTHDLPKETVRREISKAFQTWSDAVPGLLFTEETHGGPVADLEIQFVSGDHGDGYAFDGRGKTLAHAFFPQKGNMHFDEDETWTSESTSGTNILQVAIHELGHSLGLDHSEVKDAIMAPFYRGYVPNVKLHSDDIAGIRYLYPDRLSNVMDNQFCKIQVDGSIDAMISINSSLFAFKGSEYVRLDMNGIMPGYPKQISTTWHNAPSDDIDAAVYLPVAGVTSGPLGSVYFFKASQVWCYTMNGDLNFNLNSGYPKPISAEFTNLPSDLNAAFIWSGNGKLYFTKGTQYYRVDGFSVARGYPRPLSLWRNVPAAIDTVFSYQTTGRTYFVKNGNYYRFNDRLFRVDAGYPKSLAQCWFGCMSSGSSDCDHSMMMEMMEGGRQFQDGMPRSGGNVVATTFPLSSLLALLSLAVFYSG